MKLFGAFLLICLISAAPSWTQSGDNDLKLQNHLQRAREAAAKNQYDEAWKELREANKEKNNRCDVCYLELANLFGKMGDLQRMLENAQKALTVASTDSTRAEAHDIAGVAMGGLAVNDRKKLHEAETEFRAAIQLSPQTPRYHLNLGIILLKQSQSQEGIQELNQYLTLAPDGPYASTAKKMIANPRRAGETFAPEFHLATLQGTNLSLDQLTGKIIVLDFWATWCGPCRASVPELKELEKKYSHDQLELISISADEDEKQWRDFVDKQQMEWPQFLDRNGTVRNDFNVHSFPTYVVIDEEGVIIQKIVGENSKQSIVYRLKATLNANSKLNAKN